MLDVSGLRVSYGETVAVDGIDLHVERGEIVALLGPSGCGKSTILRAIAGLVVPDTGRIVLEGEDLAGVPAHRRGLGLMFQDYALFPHRDVAGNVAFGLRMQRASSPAIAARLREVLDLVGLHGFEKRSIASLSGGEQQRVALARALAPAPRLLMLDEPLGSLDRALRERLTVELRELFVRLGLTTITVTHDQGEAFTLADTVVVMRDGRVEQIGRPVDLWRQPANAFVARFLGFGNVFDVDVRGGAVTSPWGPLPCERADGPGALVIRPDGVRLADHGLGVAGTARAASFRGDHFRVVVSVGDLEVEVVERDDVPAVGAPVSVVLDRAAALVVDRS